jgi:dipeptide/tripeptide permease
LDNVLYANAAFSGLTGVLLLFATQIVGAWLGVSQTLPLVVLGIGLLVYGAVIVVTARATELRSAAIWSFVALDVGWVVGSLALLAIEGVVVEPSGRWLVVSVATVVALFAGLQTYALGATRMTGAETSSSKG